LRADIHAHFVDRAYLEDLRALWRLTAQKTSDGKTLLRKDGYTAVWFRDDMFDIDHRLREMDRKEIDIRVLSLSTPNVYPWDAADQVPLTRRVNDALAGICRSHPDRFAGLASLPLKDIDASLSELDRVLDLGMKGVMIGSNVDGAALNDSRFEPLWQKINRLRLPVFEHPMFPTHTDDMREFELPLRVGLIFDTTLCVTRLIYSGVFERYADFPYIAAHTGGALLMMLDRLDNGYRVFPDCREHISKPPSEYARRLYYDTAAFGAPALMLAMECAGSGHLLFGTDDPYIDSDAGHVERLPISDRDKTAILGENLAALLNLRTSTTGSPNEKASTPPQES
jgi:aminocarboxymuconate-semialdehyde decarboxylase